MKRSKLAGMTAAFLILMILFTVLSRAADSAGIANVTLGRPQNMMIAHEVCGIGRVEQNQECAVVTEAGQRVKAVYVNEGQQVKKGELLFELDLDSLKESILKQRQEIQKLEFQLEDAASQEEVGKQRRANDQAQAAENYSLSTSRASVSLSHARENLEKAKKELKDYREKKGTGGEDTLAEQELEQICEECSAAYVQAQQDLQTLQWRVEKAVDDALRQAKQESAAGGAPEQILSGVTAECVPNTQRKTGSADIQIDSIEIEEPGPDDGTAGNSKIETTAGGNESDTPGGDTGGNSKIETTAGGNESDTPGGDAAGNSGGSGIGSAWDSSTGGENEPIRDNSTGEENDPVWDSSAGPENSLPGNQTAAHSLTQQELDQIEQGVRAQYAAELEAAQQAADDALAEKQKAEAALEDCRQKMLAASDSQSAEQEQQLIDAVKAAQMSYEDAAIAANEAAVTGSRQVVSAGLPEVQSSTADIYQLDLKQMKLELSKLRKLKKADGRVEAPVDGIVTGIHVTAGERTPDGTAVMLADLTKGCRLTAEIPQEQEKYIGRGDLVTVKSEDGKTTLEDISVETVTAKTEDESVCLVTVQIPDSKLQAGMTAELSLTKKSAAYPLCIPLAALHLDEKNQPYVLAVQEINSILGTEMQAFKVPVKVEERNDSYAALAQGGISSSQSIIVSSDRPVDEGSRVRTTG